MSKETQTTPHEKITCPECQVGVFELKHLTYLTRLENELITVPEFPAWVCDVCGQREYDQRALNWLAVILDSQREHRSPTHRPRRHHPVSDESPSPTILE